MPALTIRPAILPGQLLREARRYAGVDATVLIIGETGVGKDALARYIHAAGPRRHEPFVTVNCPALPSTLIEAELFGHERGAFTDAGVARPGRFEQAAHGTLYLDAVTALSPSAQGAMLRVIEERLVTRLGATAPRDVHARFIASADARIDELVANGVLRGDLYHRLRVLPIHVPPLRDRRYQIVPLARHFLDAIGRQHGRSSLSLSTDAEDVLARYEWPGNVRELRHVIERGVLTSSGDRIDASSLPRDLLKASDPSMPATDSQRPTLEEVERRYIALTLQLTRGNQTRAAAILGISRKALWEKRKRFALA
jgi:DNA-binding NtrC family response regulator